MSACRLVAGLLVACLVVGCGATRKTVGTVTRSGVKTAFHRRAVEWRLAASVTGRLPAPLQDAAPAATRRFVVLLGGLSAADTSTSGVLHATARGARTAGSLPAALHDAAAATIGGRTYVFGGGNGIAQLDQIVRAPAEPAGHLPQPSSDQSGATIGDTAYVVGGYTGQRWLNTIVAFDTRRGARVVAHLPDGRALRRRRGRERFADHRGRVVAGRHRQSRHLRLVAGPRARAPDRPASGRDDTRGAASLGDVVYIVGGRGASLDTPTDRIVAVDVRNASVRLAGRLPQPTSDAPAATLHGRILVFGGHTAGGTTDAIVSLVRRTPATARRVATANVYAADTPTHSTAQRGMPVNSSTSRTASATPST